MNAQIREEAAEWLVEFRTDEVGPATRERFAMWLRSSPAHVRAYLELAAFWEDAGFYDSTGALDVESLVSLARTETNVVTLEPPSIVGPGRDLTPPRPHCLARKRSRLAAAAVVAAFAVVTGAWLLGYPESRYITEVGEQRSIRLADGSSVELNALSRIRVRFSQHERTVDLLAGQALFRVAKDATRPFLVLSAGTRVRAIGTQFDVNRKQSSTIVTVIEGRVAILPQSVEKRTAAAPTSSGIPIELAAGEQATVTPSAAPHLQRANVATATAWTQQQLIFESTPLPDVAEEFNRFNAHRLLVSPELADFRINGTFSATDPASLSRFLVFLREQPGIEVLESADQIVVEKSNSD
jgi:transmembrane sensor